MYPIKCTQKYCTCNSVFSLISENLRKEFRNMAWDRVKVICTQPYKKEAFGLSLLQLHGKELVCNTVMYGIYSVE